MNSKLYASALVLAGLTTGCSQNMMGQSMSGPSQMKGASQQTAQSSQTSQTSQSSQASQATEVEKLEAKPKRSVRRVVKQAYQPKRNYHHRAPVRRVARGNVCYKHVAAPHVTYQNRTQRVLVKSPTAKRVQVRPAQYRTQNRTVVVRPATQKTIRVPAVYRNVKRTVETSPGVVQIVNQRVMASPARTIRQAVPAVTRNQQVRTLAAPAVYKTVRTPAQYQNRTQRVAVKTTRMVKRPTHCHAPRVQRQHRPVYNYTRQQQPQMRVMSLEGYAKWLGITASSAGYTPKSSTAHAANAHAMKGTSLESYARMLGVSAGDNAATAAPATKSKVADKADNAKKAMLTRKIQQALVDKGYEPGPVDGQWGSKTEAQLKKFQKDTGLEVGVINKTTLRALSIIR